MDPLFTVIVITYLFCHLNLGTACTSVQKGKCSLVIRCQGVDEFVKEEMIKCVIK